MPKSKLYWLQSLSVSVMLLSGCGDSPSTGVPKPAALQSAQASLDEGSRLLQTGDYAAAEQALATAMSGPLRSDSYVQAGRDRAVALGHLGKRDQAFSIIEDIRSGLSDDAEYHLLRGMVCRADNDESTAKSEFDLARKLDRRIAIPAK